MNILQELYDSEINAGIQTFWDGGFDWNLGAPMEPRATGTADTLAAAEKDIEHAALRHYPDSDFAKRRKVPA